MSSPQYTGLFGQMQTKTPSCPITKSFDSLSSTLLYIIVSMFVTYLLFSIWDNFERYSCKTIKYNFPSEKPSQLDIVEKKVNHILNLLEEIKEENETKEVKIIEE